MTHYARFLALVGLGGATAVAWNALAARGWTTADLASGLALAGAHVLENPLPYAFAALCLFWLLPSRTPAVYMLDFAVFSPPEEWLVTQEEILECCRRSDCFSEESLEFQRKILARSGTGPRTAWPPGIIQLLHGAEKADVSMAAARAEAERVIFSCVEEVLAKTGVKPKAIDFLIVNCSLFCPTPSLCAMVARKFGLRSDLRSYNLAGMGCSAGVISIDLARQLMEARPNSLALVVSTENITQNLYRGSDTSMLVQNTLFRCGGAAILLSNKTRDAFRAKYKLLHTIRTQNASEEAYNCVFQIEDEAGNRGVRLSKDITTIAGRSLKDNLTLLGPLVLPFREQLRVVLSEIVRIAAKTAKRAAASQGWVAVEDAIEVPAPYIPDFKKGLDHFCIHAGGRAVIDGIEKNLSLHKEHTAPSRATLYQYGNTSSSSIWYELKFVEQEEDRWVAENAGHPVQRGDRVVQIAFGSGFKCNSAVWVRMK